MSFPPPHTRPSRLTGLAIVLCLIALLAPPAGSAAVGATLSMAVGAASRVAVGVAVGVAASSVLTSAAAESGAVWMWPIRPSPLVIRPFEQPPTRYAAGHRGIDIATVPGSPVYSPAAGIVHFSGAVGGRPVLSLEHPGGVLSSFEPVVSALTRGDRVAPGEFIGTVGGPSASHCTDCVHVGVRRDGEYLSPLRFLGGIGPAVLLPTRRLAGADADVVRPSRESDS